MTNKVSKKEILTGKEWEVLNTFVQEGGKWLIRAINRTSREITEFVVSSGYLNKVYKEGRNSL